MEKIKYRVAETLARVNRGDYWISQIQLFIDPFKVATYATLLKVWIPSITVEAIVVLTFTFAIVKIILKYGGGMIDEYKGFWEAQSQYSAKKVHINPFNDELKKTLKRHSEILSKLSGEKIENYFNELP